MESLVNPGIVFNSFTWTLPSGDANRSTRPALGVQCSESLQRQVWARSLRSSDTRPGCRG